MATELTRWPSPAKLNLFLHILGRLPNGYHQLETLFQLLDYGDTLQFEVTEQGCIELMTPTEGVAAEDNLVFKAAQILRQHSNITQGCKIWLDKKLPMGGGIGGGSSNAATTLLALNYYWQCGLSLSELAKLGQQLGADVPVFVQGNSAFAAGTGEKLSPATLPQAFYVVAFPRCHVSTAAVFNSPLLPRQTAPMNFSQYRFEDTHNDCQELVFSLYPPVANAFNWLIEYAPSRMTGTGACVFARFENKAAAQHCLNTIPDNVDGFIAQGVNRSAVHLLLEKLTDESHCPEAK